MTTKGLIYGMLALVPLAGTGTAVRAPAGRFAHVSNCASACGGVGPGNVSAFAIDGATGALTSVAGSPFAAGTNPFSVTVSPNGQFVYVANANSNSIGAYSIDASGALTPVAGSPFISATTPFSVTVAPNGQFVYVAISGSNNVLGFSVDTTGALTPLTGFRVAAETRPVHVSVEPASQFAFVVNERSSNVSVYSVDAAGALAPVAGSPFLVESFPRALATTAGPAPGPLAVAKR